MSSLVKSPGSNCIRTIHAHLRRHCVAGSVQLTGARYATDLTLESARLTSTVTGFTVLRDDVFSTRMEFAYVYDNGPEHKFNINTKAKDNSNAKANKYNANL